MGQQVSKPTGEAAGSVFGLLSGGGKPNKWLYGVTVAVGSAYAVWRWRNPSSLADGAGVEKAGSIDLAETAARSGTNELSKSNTTTTGTVIPPSDSMPIKQLLVRRAVITLLIVTTSVIVVIVWQRGIRYFTISSTKPEDLVNRGNSLKALQSWLKAGQKFEAAAEQFSKQRRGEHDAANNYSEAANCYRKLPEKRVEAVRCMQLAAEIYAEQGQFSIAARHLEEAGDLSRSLGDEASVSRAIELFQKAADYWSGEDSPASSAGSRAKAAELMADCERLREAAQLFEDLGVSAESHSLLGFGAKDHLAKCCLCLLCSDAVGVGEKAEQLAGLCGSFKDSDELSLVRSLAAAAEARDVGALDAAVTEFERFNNVDDFGRRRLDQLREIVAGGSGQLQ